MPHTNNMTSLKSNLKDESTQQKLPEKRKRIIGGTTYNISLAYDESGDTLQELFLQIIKEKEAC